MTIIAAVAQKDWGIIVSDSWSHIYDNEGSNGTFINKVRSLPQHDMAVAMNGSVHACETFLKSLTALPLPNGMDDLEEDGLDIFREAMDNAADDLDPDWQTGDSIEESHPLTMAQVAIVGYSQRRGTFAAISFIHVPGSDVDMQVEEPGGGIFSPAVMDFDWSAKANRKKGFVAELVRYSQEQYKVFHDRTADSEFDPEASKTGGQAIATILQRGSIEQRVVDTYPNYKDVCEQVGATPRRVKQSMSGPVQAPEAEGTGGTEQDRPARKVGRNEPCPCGSGQKAKRCCHA